MPMKEDYGAPDVSDLVTALRAGGLRAQFLGARTDEKGQHYSAIKAKNAENGRSELLKVYKQAIDAEHDGNQTGEGIFVYGIHRLGSGTGWRTNWFANVESKSTTDYTESVVKDVKSLLSKRAPAMIKPSHKL